ncbi:TIGR02452 family protein [Chondromyces crocatus]|uniref:Microbial-type PARG catalytic domain-containing protein n=1 Tax=Chondromyces crocatus TaxID=52 RepID=A0A0K1EBQ2_CHOCO|nr:TIGR02452 family protein [Chondromyces crocatus]AKT38295.1 uncharacterized protein CMC5_024400 [Chondromyces crocatus]
MKLKAIATENLAIYQRGSYEAPSGRTVRIGKEVSTAVERTVLHRPGTLDDWTPTARRDAPPRIEVTDETTGAAGRRLVEQEGEARVLALNFASAKNPGGGFINGAKAQEEDLARCSALYPCLIEQREYYTRNRGFGSFLYTDHLVYSPDVPFFRDERYELLEQPFALSLLTAPAPNAGEARRQERASPTAIRSTLDRRAELVLAAAGHHDHRCVILGAWGCGVFRNSPEDVAAAFAQTLALARFQGAFDRIVFAVYDRGRDQPNLRAFERQFGRASTLAPSPR